MRALTRMAGLAIAVWIAMGPCMARAQMVQATPLPAPGTTMPQDSKMERAYTIQRGMPYSGVRAVQHVVIFPNGSRQDSENSTKEWRDSAGRTREDITWRRRIGGIEGGIVTVCQIDDPVALVRYIWKVELGQKTVVTESHYKMEGTVTEIWPDPPNHKIEAEPGRTIIILSPHPRNLNANANDETLGPEYINGVYAEGSRSVDAIPPGGGGNGTDHPVYRIDEIWMAPDLSMVVKTFLDDGLGFTERSELKNIDRSEPDPSVFRPPAGLQKRKVPESDPVWKEPIASDW